MTPEERARQTIDPQLEACGWLVQDYRQMDLSAGVGIAVREFPLTSGEADYLLNIDGRAIGVVEPSRAELLSHVLRPGLAALGRGDLGPALWISEFREHGWGVADRGFNAQAPFIPLRYA